MQCRRRRRRSISEPDLLSAEAVSAAAAHLTCLLIEGPDMCSSSSSAMLRGVAVVRDGTRDFNSISQINIVCRCNYSYFFLLSKLVFHRNAAEKKQILW